MIEIQPTLADRIVSYFDPVRGARRMRARSVMALAGAYKGSRRDRDATKAWTTRRGDADADTLDDLDMLRQRSHDLVRNSPLATGVINTKVTSVVGTGLKLQAAIDRDQLPHLTDEQADDWEANTEREYRLFAESLECDAARSLNFYGHQELAWRATLESGDHFVLMPHIERVGSPYGLKLQAVEADRVANKGNVRDSELLAGGVERDENGAPIRYHIMDQHPGSNRSSYKGTWTLVDAFGEQTGRRNVIHLYKMLRPGQSRGVPDLAPVIEQLKQIDRYTDYELHASAIASAFTTFITTDTGEGLAGLNATDYVEQSNEFYKERNLNLKAGTSVHLFPDDKVEFANPTRPNSSFDPFVQSVLRQIGVALEIPFELLIKHFTASFSASQAAFMEAWKFFRTRRQWLADNFCQVVYENWMTEAVALGRIEAPGFFDDPAIRAAYLGAAWIGPPREHMDPVKQNRADQMAEDRGWKTAAENTAERGGDWEKKHKQRVKEQRARREDGLEPDPADDAETSPPLRPVSNAQTS